MSAAFVAKVWDIRFASPAHKLLLLALADEADGAGMFSYPDLARLETKVGLAAPEIADLLHVYTVARAIRVVQSVGRSHEIRTVYKLCPDRLPEIPLREKESVSTLAHYRVLLEAQRFFKAKFPKSTYVWRRLLKRCHSRFEADYAIELTHDLCLRVVNPRSGDEVVRSQPGRFDRLGAAPAR